MTGRQQALAEYRDAQDRLRRAKRKLAFYEAQRRERERVPMGKRPARADA